MEHKDKTKADLSFLDWESSFTWLCLFYGFGGPTLPHKQRLYLYNKGCSISTAYNLGCDVAGGYTLKQALKAA